MKIYVAAKFQDKERATKLMDYLRKQGHTITHDWTKYDQSTDELEMRMRAEDDVKGVNRADLLIMILVEDLKYTGTFVEMGVAIAKGIPIIIIGKQRINSVFTKLSNVVRITEDFLV